MEHLWAPWRIEYIKITKEEGCILCQKPQENSDTANYILHRGRKNFVIMNKYPYNSGHLMVAPNRHTAIFEELAAEELCEHYELVQRSIVALKKLFKPEGFNIGMNLGRIAGAGIDKHLHTHIVPRWAGDTNFMPIIADTNIVNEALDETYKKLIELF